MKSKIGLIAVVLASGLLLSACTNKQSTDNDTSSANGTQVEQGTNSPSGTPDNKGPGQQMDLAAAAKTLGVTEDALKAALGINNMPSGQSPQSGQKPEESAPTANN